MTKTSAAALSLLLAGCMNVGDDDSQGSLSGPGQGETDGDASGGSDGNSDGDGPSGSGDDNSSSDTDSAGDTDSDSGDDTDDTGGDTDGDPFDPGAEGWPVGVPYPEFGVDETVQSVHGDAGFFTHYVDNTAACDDGGNGSADSPRCSLPLSGLAAGDVVFIAAGSYPLGDVTFSLPGSEAAPVFFRGPDEGEQPVITGQQSEPTKFDVSGSYFILENLEFAYARVSMSGDHGTLRHSRTHDSDKTGVSLGGSHMAVLYSEVDHHQTANRLGVSGGCGSDQLWIVGNHIHHNAEDSVQFGHGCEGMPPSYIYVGGNRMHSDRENAVDFKWVQHVIVSQNEMYGYVQAREDEEFCYDDDSRCDPPGYHSSGSDGSAVAIGTDGESQDIWILLNEIHDSVAGVRNEEATTTTVYANLIYDVARGLVLEKNAIDLYFYNNVVHGADVGVSQTWRENFRLHIANNIFVDIPTVLQVESGDVASVSTFSNNLLYNGGAAMTAEWGQSRQVNSAADLAGMAGTVADNVVADPQLGDADGADFTISMGSPATGAGDGTDVEARFSAFASAYGPSIAVDYGEADRPIASWDIGPYEAE